MPSFDPMAQQSEDLRCFDGVETQEPQSPPPKKRSKAPIVWLIIGIAALISIVAFILIVVSFTTAVSQPPQIKPVIKEEVKLPGPIITEEIELPDFSTEVQHEEDLPSIIEEVVEEETEEDTPSTQITQVQPIVPTKGGFDPNDVPNTASKLDGHYYQVYNGQDVGVTNMEEAIRFCAMMGGYPASITTQDEARLAQSLLADHGSFYVGLSDGKWISGETANDLITFSGSGRYGMISYAGQWSLGNMTASDHVRSTVTVSRASASSSLDEGLTIHTPDRMFDNDITTAWSESAPGLGIGEYVTIEFSDTQTIGSFTIRTGYQSTPEFFGYNARPSSIELRWPDGSSETYSLQDTPQPQTIALQRPVTADKVTLILAGSYKGTQFEDTCICELQFSPAAPEPLRFLCEWGEYTLE